MFCQVTAASLWIGIGVIPPTFIGLDDPLMFMPDMPELVELGTWVPGVTVVIELLAELPQPASAMPATPATITGQARTAAREILSISVLLENEGGARSSRAGPRRDQLGQPQPAAARASPSPGGKLRTRQLNRRARLPRRAQRDG